MKDLTILLVIVFAPFFALAQGQDDSYSISGKVNLLIGLDLVPAQEVLVVVKSSGHVVTTDSLGNFKLENMKQGKHLVEVIGASFPTIDTTVVIIDKSVTGLTLLAITECLINQDIARNDIKNNKPMLLLAGGIAPVSYPNQYKFEKKYGVVYHEFGDMAPNQQCMVKYNKAMFEYLDSKYGRKWRKDVRRDVVGL